MSKNNFNLSDSLIDAVKKIHDDAVEKQAASASDTEEKNAQFLVDQAERIAKYSKQVFGEIDEEIGNMVKLAKEKKKLKVRARKDYVKVARRKADDDFYGKHGMTPQEHLKNVKKEEVEPEEQLDELSKETMKRYKGKAKFDAVHSLARDDIGRAKKRFSGLDAAKRLQKEEVEEQIDEKYIGFKKLEGKLAGKGVRNPGAVAASIGRKKYGAAKFNKAAHEHKKMKGMKAEEVNYIEEAMKQRIIDKVMELRNKDK